MPRYSNLALLAVLSLASRGLAIDPLPEAPTADQMLLSLQQVGADLQSLQSDVELKETNVVDGDESIRVGKVWIQQKDAAGGKARIRFDSVEREGRIKDEVVEYRLADGVLTDRNYARKLETQRQILKPGEQMNLLRLGEGPFPLPIGQDPQEVKRQFKVEIVDAKKAAEAPPDNTVGVRLIPEPDTAMAREFARADVWVDRDTHLPARIDVRNRDNLRITRLKNLKLNVALTDKDFELPNIDNQGWNRHFEALKNQ